MRVPGSWLFYLVLFWAALLAICSSTAKAAPKTNINEVTSLFDDHIQGKDRLLNDLKGQMDSAVSGVKSKSGFEMIEGMSGAENKAAELSRIRATDLDNEGRRKRVSEEYRFYDENELEPDYTKPGNRLHKQDADDIARATGNVLGNLIAKLKDLNIDCKTIKGPVQKEPVYYIDIKRENQRNTEYDQFFCQEPRNKYNCRDELKLRCERKGIKWNNWEQRSIKIDGDRIYREAQYLGYSIKWKKKRHGWHIHQDSAGWRSFLSNYLNIPIEQIHEIITFPHGARGVGGSTHPVYERWRIVFDQYEFGYKYRDGYEVCEEWKEDWTERCILQ